VAEATMRSTSSVSQQLKLLERESGVPLTVRVGRGVRLTDAGRALADSADRVIVAMAESQAVWDEFRNRPTGTVTLLSFPSAARLILPPLLLALEKRPELRVVCQDRIVQEDEFVGLTTDFDVVIAHSNQSSPAWQSAGLAVVPLFTEPFDIALPLNHRLARSESIEPADLAGESWIGVPEGFPYHGVIDEVQATTGTPARVLQRFADFSITEQVVAAGLGIAALPSYTTRASQASRFALRPLTGGTAQRQVALLARPEKASRLAVRQVIDEVLEATAQWRPASQSTDRSS
jgi:DNA-binding transcriptional LysR family regulator